MIESEFAPPIPDIIAEIEALSDDLQNKALRSGLTASAKPFKDRLKANVPRDSGALSRSIGQAVLSATARSRLGYAKDDRVLIVGPVRKAISTIGNVTKKRYQGYKANWLEKGTKPHNIPKDLKGEYQHHIPRRNGKGFYVTKVSKRRKQLNTLRFVVGGRVVFAESVRHPGIAATHWMERSYFEADPNAATSFYTGLQKYLEKQRKLTAAQSRKGTGLGIIK